jgi:amidophosphoribosyltransferase
MLSEEISEACGVFGITSASNRDIFRIMYWGLLSLNHRGQQSYGFTTLKDGNFRSKEDLNLIPTDPRTVDDLENALKGRMGISNARYATSGGGGMKHLEGGKQPFVVSDSKREIAVSYNGNIVNASELRADLEKENIKFMTDADTEVLCRQLLLYLDEFHGDYAKATGSVMDNLEGAYSCMVIDSSNYSFHAFRDVHGIRPYCFGKLDDMFAFCSETPALEINNFSSVDYVQGGELVSVDRGGKLVRMQIRKSEPAMCSFEFAYFSRPDSILNGTDRPVYKIREQFSESLAKTYNKKLEKIDLILSMPETADDAAYGLHRATGISWERAIRKNRYVTRRAFISQSKDRDDVIDKKVNIVSKVVKGKNLALVEDSIVRGDTSAANIKKLRKSGAKSIHLFVSFPKIAHPCLYGVDMATYGELIGSKYSPSEIAEKIGADSVNFQTEEGLVDAVGLRKDSLCMACVNGKYPTEIAGIMAKRGRARKQKTCRSTKRVYEQN